MKKIYFLLSHPIQYHSPLFDQFTQHPGVKLKVYYCSNYGISETGKRHHPEFGTLPNWNVDLTRGHLHEFLGNHSPRPSIFKGFWGLMNWGIYGALKKDLPDVLIINGWNYFSLIWAAVCCKIIGIQVFVRGDNTLEHELKLNFIKKKIKLLLYKHLLFKLYDRIGYVGERNKSFFLNYGVSPDKLIRIPHAIDNKRFRNYYVSNISNKSQLREKLGIKNNFTILFVGRLHNTKRPIDLVEAAIMMKNNAQIIFVGDGILRKKIEDFCRNLNFKNYIITGFVNQQEILKYYLVGDVLILPSEGSETWGLVVNEAMNFDLPVIVSDQVGCGPDLCTSSNGFVFQMGNIKDLADKIDLLVNNFDASARMGKESGKVIQRFSYEVIIKNILSSLN